MVYKAHLAHRFVCGTDLATTLWVRSPDSVREPMPEDALKAVMDSLARPITLPDGDRLQQVRAAGDLLKSGDPMDTARALRSFAALHAARPLSRGEWRTHDAAVTQLSGELELVRGLSADAAERQVRSRLGLL
ncbi:MAG: hypothetical protein H6734_04075 [Alphaproteobacteria bacterium]|nr:hypothetical protein [Alphaproteobacteria bacterium]